MFRHGWKFVSLIVVASLIFLWLIKASVMSIYLTDKVGVPVTMRTISMWPKETTMHHFRIDNPPGFKALSALVVKKTTISYQFSSLIGNPSEINEILLDGVDLNIEIRSSKGSDNNWTAIGAQMPKSKKPSKAVIIHKLIIRNMTVETQGKGAKALGVAGKQHFDQMEFNEINSAQGFPTKELVTEIFKNAGLLKYLENFLNPTERIKEALNPFKIFGKEKPAE